VQRPLGIGAGADAEKAEMIDRQLQPGFGLTPACGGWGEV
jgi:hypothetical protein